MGLPELARRPGVRRFAVGLVVVAVAWCTRCRWDQLTEAHVPYVDWDTQIYQQIADRPLGFDLVFEPKALFVPLIYRAAHNDVSAVIGFQTGLAFIAWAVLTASLVLALRRRWTRAIALGLGVAFVLAPLRVGFTGSLLPESIGDSLTALLTAGAIGLVRLRGRARIAVAIGTGLLGLAWMLTRDTNVFIAVTAALVAMILWRGWRFWWAGIAASVVIATAVAALWTTGKGHEPLPYQQTWYPRFMPRSAYPLVDNVIARAFSELPPDLTRLAEPRAQIWRVFEAHPELQPLQDWLVDHGGAAYARWLVRHPLDRALELIDARWTVLTGSNRRYMPGGWVRRSLVGGLTANHAVLLALILAAPVLLWKPRADPMRGLALCMIASGIIGAAASYYGDAAEVARHCYGAGQQIVLGLVLALVVWLDRQGRGAARGALTSSTGSPG